MRSLVVVLILLVSSAPLARAGAWTQPRGQLWFKSAALYSFTRDHYAPNAAILPGGTRVERGDRRPFDDQGTARMRLLWTEAEYGLTDRVTVGASLPWFDLRYEDRFQLTDSWGVGDVRLSTRVALLTGRDRVSTRVTWKLPVGEAATDPDDVPLGEGQSDLDLALQYGRSLGRPLSWLGGESGFRLRGKNEEQGRDPGDEWFWRVEAGWALDRAGRVALLASADGLRGGETEYDDLGVIPGERRYDSVSLGILIPARDWLLDLSWSRTLAGEAFPAGNTYGMGISRSVQAPWSR